MPARSSPESVRRAASAPQGQDEAPTARLAPVLDNAERTAIVKAAYKLIGRAGGGGVSVQEILTAAGLSTRAFYRHFQSKDELILTMYRTASDRVSAELADVLASTPDPAAALRGWIRHQLSVVYEARRARQTEVLVSVEARGAAGFDRVQMEGFSVRRAQLAELLRRGRAERIFPAVTDPDEDARAVMGAVNAVITAIVAGRPTPSWEDATTHISELFLRAFGAPRARTRAKPAR